MSTTVALRYTGTAKAEFQEACPMIEGVSRKLGTEKAFSLQVPVLIQSLISLSTRRRFPRAQAEALGEQLSASDLLVEVRPCADDAP